MTWNQRFRATRIRKAMTQADIAELLGVNQTQVSLWEVGKQRPQPRNRRKIAEFLGERVESINFEEVMTDADSHDHR